VEAGWQHAGFVQDEDVVRVKQIWQVAEEVMGEGAARSLEHQKAGRIARSRRRLGDEPRRQVVFEIGSAHP